MGGLRAEQTPISTTDIDKIVFKAIESAEIQQSNKHWRNQEEVVDVDVHPLENQVSFLWSASQVVSN